MEKFQRLNRAQVLFTNYLGSKFAFKKCYCKVASVCATAGPFTTNGIKMEHPFILSTITGAPFTLETQTHGGVRGKRTVTLNSHLYENSVWPFHDRFIGEFLRYSFEYQTPKELRPMKGIKTVFTWRIREQFRLNPDYALLFEDSMWSSNRGKFLPLNISYKIKNSISNIMSENYMRMIKLPHVWFKYRDRKVFDDLNIDRWRWLYWWYYLAKFTSAVHISSSDDWYYEIINRWGHSDYFDSSIE